MSEFNLAPIEDAIADLKAGKMIIVVDDEDRENEGDLICMAEKITPEMVTFMAKQASGLICLALPHEQIHRLNLEPMAPKNQDKMRTAFTVSIDAREGVTTGISSADRARTIKLAASLNAKPEDFNRPGHIFPLAAKKGCTLERAGHTEAAVDLARLAGAAMHAGVICEIMNEDGTMARMPQLSAFAKKHALKMITIEALIKYRRKMEVLIEEIVETDLPTKFGKFRIKLYMDKCSGNLHIGLVMGEIKAGEPVLTRVHSECLTGDILGSLKCDCGDQLRGAMEMIEKNGSGVLLYMRQEGRGIGLANKLKAYKLQNEQGLDTVEANRALGLPDDLRDYGIGAQILFDMGVRKIKLITNNPQKIVGLSGYGLEVTDRVPLEIAPNPMNKFYLETKKLKMGHILHL
jgi:3,4-dihydroxy 2-butanone 4-phosphate synthase/GTP cyclohydrolase II